jgi:hypothetical protein
VGGEEKPKETSMKNRYAMWAMGLVIVLAAFLAGACRMLTVE